MQRAASSTTTHPGAPRRGTIRDKDGMEISVTVDDTGNAAWNIGDYIETGGDKAGGPCRYERGRLCGFVPSISADDEEYNRMLDELEAQLRAVVDPAGGVADADPGPTNGAAPPEGTAMQTPATREAISTPTSDTSARRMNRRAADEGFAHCQWVGADDIACTFPIDLSDLPSEDGIIGILVHKTGATGENLFGYSPMTRAAWPGAKSDEYDTDDIHVSLPELCQDYGLPLDLVVDRMAIALLRLAQAEVQGKASAPSPGDEGGDPATSNQTPRRSTMERTPASAPVDDDEAGTP